MSSAPLSLARARELVLSSVTPLQGTTVGIENALGRVLAADLRASGDAPPFTCSAMDGYAIVPGEAGRRLRVVGESRAGSPASAEVDEGTAVRISTGAAVPKGAGAVIRQEDTAPRGNPRAQPDQIETLVQTPGGANIRHAGEDIRRGAPVLSRGTRLGWAELAAAVAAGAAELAVARRPRVAVLVTGDELRPAGALLRPGELHNSNGPMLEALARSAGAEPDELEPLPDDRAETERGLAAALAQADVVIVSGGVSVGPHDHVRPALAALGVQERFWRVALQPGKPTWFGVREQQLVFGLPGNPVSAAVTFVLFALPALRVLQHEPPEAGGAEAELARSIRRSPDREQAVRVSLSAIGGRLTATPTGAQESHRTTSLLGADALALIERGEGQALAGDQVPLVALPGRMPVT